MKTTPRSPTDQNKPLRSPPEKPGFALVISLTLMSLIILLVISMATLVKVELSTELHTQNQSLARQNALFGLQVAIGQLQQQMGPDKRVSATASILDITPEDANFDDSETAPNVRQPHWTGVWNSLDWDRSSNREDSPTLPKASDGKPNEFRGWLVSGFSNTQLTGAEMIGQATSFDPNADDSILLVGEGTVGQTTDTRSDYVYAKREVLQTEEWNESGFAYWVGDEGVKAPISGEPIEAPSVNLDKLNAISSNSRANLRALTDWSELDYETLDASSIFSHDILKLTAIQKLGSSQAYQGKFHDVSPHSRGMLIDTRNGGFRKDLSLAFSEENLPEAFLDEIGNPEKMFALGPENAPIVWGPTWDYVQRYHNRYKMQIEGEDGTPVMNIVDVKPEVSKSLIPNKPGDAPLPVIYRYQYIISLYQGYNTADGRPHTPDSDSTASDFQSNDKIVYLMVTPVIYFWNPYNVAIKMPANDTRAAINILAGFPPFELSFDGGNNYRRFDDIFMYHAGELIALESSNWTDRKELIIPPGEMRINTFGTLDYRARLYLHSSHGLIFWGEAARPDLVDRRNQPLTDEFSEGVMGLFSPLLLPPQTPGASKYAPETKLLANGQADIHLRFTPNVTNYIFKMNLGSEDDNANRENAGVLHVDAPYGIDTEFLPAEYIHDESIDLSSLPELGSASGGFSGINPILIVNYNIRAFQESNALDNEGQAGGFGVAGGLGKPGLFTDPTNGYYYSLDTDEEALAMAPFRISVEGAIASGDYVQYDQSTKRAMFKSGADLVYSNLAKELPVSPLLSINQLEHAPLGRDQQHLVYQYTNLADSKTPPSHLQNSDPRKRSMGPVYNRAVGNGYLHPMLEEDSVWDEAYAVDRSYFLNDVLFDGYYFSGLADSGGIFAQSSKNSEANLDDILEGNSTALNPAYKLHSYNGETMEEIASNILEENGDEYLRLAAYLSVDRAFNINSTSVDAWAAMLSSSRGKTVMYSNPTGNAISEESDSDRTPVISKTLPAGSAAEKHTGNYQSANAALWSGFRTLTDQQIHELAEEIVTEVKARGPFQSLGQFFNREISNRDNFNRKAAVQSAIDRVGLNKISDDGALKDALESRFDSNEIKSVDIATADGLASTDALLGDRNEGLPGFITQAELLKPITPSLSARSETFIIRSYGDVRDANGIVAEAWCEAVVQRKTNYVNPEDPTTPEPWEMPLPDTPADTFGREFEIVSFRWLAKDEV